MWTVAGYIFLGYVCLILGFVTGLAWGGLFRRRNEVDNKMELELKKKAAEDN